MTVIVVVGQGWGTVWRFESLTEAQVHPEVEDGVDAVLSTDLDLLRDYNRLEWPKLMYKLKLEGATAIATVLRSCSPLQARDVMRANVARVWQALVDQSCLPPPNPNKERLMSEKKAAEAKVVEAKTKIAEVKTVDKEPKVPAGPKAPKGYALEDIISFGKHPEGKEYGPENNPKRPGSGSHARFALLKNGMTIGDALAAGVETADILWDVSHKFITIKKAAVLAAA